MASYPAIQDLFSCGPAKYGFDAPGGGNVCYWSASSHVVARVHRVGGLDSAEAYYFHVLDKRKMASRGIDDDPEKWEWRDEKGQPCAAPVGAIRPSIANERDYYGRIFPALKIIERSFFDSFDAELGGAADSGSHYSVQEKRWVSGLPSR